MSYPIKLEDIYDKNINFLIGSGASVGILPTLSLNISEDGLFDFTFESLAKKLFDEGYNQHYSLLFMHFYKECIEPAMSLDLNNFNDTQKKVLDNYESFLSTILMLMQRSKSSFKKCNIFTTNYDGLVIHASDNLIREDKHSFILNDGARGFHRRYLHARNFNSVVCETGIFDQHRKDIPQINLIHLHGSVYWEKDKDKILVDYNKQTNAAVKDKLSSELPDFSTIIEGENNCYSDVVAFSCNQNSYSEFMLEYQKLPIVNPTKWKFHETVFEEHYYQMLRLMSYELEIPNTVMVVFGFSFADEHILHLFQRSLSNPSLQVYICCFNSHEKTMMESKFNGYANVEFISIDGCLDFSSFNSSVFTLDQMSKDVSGEHSSR